LGWSFEDQVEGCILGLKLLEVNGDVMNKKIGEIIKQRVAVLGMSKAELARRLHMSPANVHKIFKRSSVDAALLREISNVLDYDFLQHFEPDVSRVKKQPVPYNVGDIEVLFIRYIVDLQSRVQILEQRWETFRSTGKVEEEAEVFLRRGFIFPGRHRKAG
jgi:transcriptional regulator with XRE-family HTH domain